MNEQRCIKQVAGGLATVFAWAIAATRPLTMPAQRLIRLARLRAYVKGHVPASTQFDGPVRALQGSRVDIGARCRLGRNVFFETSSAGHITLGRNVRVNMGTVIVSSTAVSISDDCLIGEYVSIRDADHGLEPGQVMRIQGQKSAPVIIGRDVWVGRGAVVLKGVTIGDGAVIGANSVVTKDVPAMTVVAGSPARPLRMRDGAPPPAT